MPPNCVATITDRTPHLSRNAGCLSSDSRRRQKMDSVDASKFRVLNMLNTKYFILPAGQQGQTVPVLNPYANGNAWFVKNVQYVNNANEEIDALKTILPTETAVVDVRFKDVLKGISEAHKDSLSSIRLTSYEPNRLVYETENAETASPYSPRYTTRTAGK